MLLGSPVIDPPSASTSQHGHGHSVSVSTITPTFAPADAGPYYRPPRTRRTLEFDTSYSPAAASRASWASEGWPKTRSDAPAPEVEAPDHRFTDSVVTVGSGSRTADYAVRESDFYYGVRGPALSAQPARRLGTGPADPTGPVSNAKSWIKSKLGLARGGEEKGFSVVRSSRAPEEGIGGARAMDVGGGGGGDGGVIGGGGGSSDSSDEDDDEEEEE